ncbi:DUF4224 domain-containing protein, partial [Escherichia coli]
MSGQIQRFLTPDDLYQLTGYRRPSLQCKALRDSGVFLSHVRTADLELHGI